MQVEQPIAAASTVSNAYKRNDFDLFGQIVKVEDLDDIFRLIWFKDWQGRLY